MFTEKYRSYSEVVFPDRSLGHKHLVALWMQELIERLIQDHAVYEAAAHIQVSVFSMNVQRDVLPLRIRQVHILKGHHVLRSLHHVDQIQRVGATVGHNLKLTDPTGTLHSKQGTPGALVLSHGGHKHKALIVLDLFKDLMEGRGAHSWDVVKADETIRR